MPTFLAMFDAISLPQSKYTTLVTHLRAVVCMMKLQEPQLLHGPCQCLAIHNSTNPTVILRFTIECRYIPYLNVCIYWAPKQFCQVCWCWSNTEPFTSVFECLWTRLQPSCFCHSKSDFQKLSEFKWDRVRSLKPNDRINKNQRT